ncbi:hypothetical protein Spla01_06160 [Streptomyces platensis]|uniref:WXG100 family type VII secretion target n=1 Tax=Streptomyces platensis TaxID=58346 RepID=A0ABX3Y896_STRPT|nr:hypothetical protein [Streptomyces platensis]OSY48485.1 hypothetical protein BG653_00362 [Streptomyces platensis]
MSNQNFPALGFNPAPGHLESVDDLTGKLDTATRSLSSAHSVLHRLGRGTGVWEGEAARAFAGQVGDLPKYVSDSRFAELPRYVGWLRQIGETLTFRFAAQPEEASRTPTDVRSVFG